MRKSILSISLCLFVGGLCSAVELVKDGKGVSEIVVPEKPLAGVKIASEELQAYIEKISGAKLPIVNKVSADVKNQIYVGESEYTKKLGLKLDDVKYDGFKIIADKNYLILAGKETYHHYKYSKFDVENRQKSWEEYTGQKWRFPPLYAYQDYSKECGLAIQDGTGTLYAVYEFLEQLGIRWYSHIEDIGTVIPETKNISAKEQNIKKEPEFPVRIMTDLNLGNIKSGFLWFKKMKVGASCVIPIYHSINCLYEKYPDIAPQEYFGVVNGKVDHNIPRMSNERLRADEVKLLEFIDKAFPGIDYLSIGQPDGWSVMDGKDAAAGWDKLTERGSNGRFSDYYWDFIMDVRKRYMEKHPDKKFTVFAYINTQRVPTNIDKVPDNMTVVFCQTASRWNLSVSRNDLNLREEWLKKMSNKDQLLIWEYYLDHVAFYDIPPVPVIFIKNIRRSFDGLYDKCAGFTVEVPWTTGGELKPGKLRLRRPALVHLMLYLHNKLCWDRNLDVNAVLNEYYELFFGPAKVEMKEFHEFAEEVWMRPEPRGITANGGFLRPADIDKFFDILKSAKTKAGNSIYGKRIAWIENEMEPLHTLFDKLKRTGPDLRCYTIKEPMNIDGDLDKTFWRDFSFTPLRNMLTGEIPTHVATNVAFRWVPDRNLVIAIECIEPKMDKLNEGCKDRDSMSIFSDDFIQINIETPNGIRPSIVVNSAGTVYDACVTTNVADLPEFYTVPKVAVKKYSGKWTVELQIDASVLGADRPTLSYPWGINICRQRIAGNAPEYYMLSPSGTNFKATKYMGNLMTR